MKMVRAQKSSNYPNDLAAKVDTFYRGVKGPLSGSAQVLPSGSQFQLLLTSSLDICVTPKCKMLCLFPFRKKKKSTFEPYAVEDDTEINQIECPIPPHLSVRQKIPLRPKKLFFIWIGSGSTLKSDMPQNCLSSKI